MLDIKEIREEVTVSSRRYTIAGIALVATCAMTWWVSSGGGPQESQVSPAPAQPEVSPAPSVTPPPPPPLAPAVVDSSPTKDPVLEMFSPKGKPQIPVKSVETPLPTLDQADPDPALSREIEYVMRRSLEANLNKNRYEVESIECRALTCKILTVDRGPPADSPPPGTPPERAYLPTFAKLLKDVHEAAIRSPTTGAALGRINPQSIAKIGDSTKTEIVISFDGTKN